jgi:hypothetical protein
MTTLAKRTAIIQGTETAYKLWKQYGVKLAFGTDTQFSEEGDRHMSALIWCC